ncbi:MAG: lamin tail domain-containing protein [Ignavibacteriales bacterium]|nr:lamin tail domain-containing protein [Ignavibacteriales bacterium]
MTKLFPVSLRAIVSVTIFPAIVFSQLSSFPYAEGFDTVTAPTLPVGWTTTTNRLPGGDFATSTSTPRSSPNCVLSTNSTIAQTLASPAFDFTSRTPDKLQFYTARSSTHVAGLLVEASTDNGASFPIQLADTIRNPGTTSYTLSTIQIPGTLANQATVMFRWRLVGGSGGTAGTFRLDDITITVLTSYDLSPTKLTISPAFPATGEPVQFSATIKNFGTQTASGYAVRFFRDSNNNMSPDSSEEFASVAGTSIAPSDSSAFFATHPPLPSGDHRFYAAVSYAQDENASNDTVSATVRVPFEKGSVVVNEIMYDPLTNQNEWIELYHRGSQPVNIINWKFSDRPTASGGINTFTITTQSRVIQPGDFVVVAAESSIFMLYPHLQSTINNFQLFILNRAGGFSLGNDGDDIILKDLTNATIDSVSYSPAWHHPDVADTKGRSLERINPNLESNDTRNWSTATTAAGGSPGKPNTIITTGLPSTTSLSISPNPFSPDGDGFEDFCSVKYNLPASTSLIRIRIYDIRGRLIRTLANAEFSGAAGEVIWDGLDDSKQRARIGPYVVLIEALDSEGGTVHTAKAVAVVATKL